MALEQVAGVKYGSRTADGLDNLVLGSRQVGNMALEQLTVDNMTLEQLGGKYGSIRACCGKYGSTTPSGWIIWSQNS